MTMKKKKQLNGLESEWNEDVEDEEDDNEEEEDKGEEEKERLKGRKKTEERMRLKTVRGLSCRHPTIT